MGGPELRYSGESRPLPGEQVNGDKWLVERIGDSTRAALVDGLGHGPEAELAAASAMDALRARPDLDPVSALLRCDEALRGTRGAAVSIIVIDTDRGLLRFAGIGNVEGQLRAGDQPKLLAPDRGILGQARRTPTVQELPLGSGWVILLYSDGIQHRELRDVATEGAPDDVARRILERCARPTDDATVVVIADEPS